VNSQQRALLERAFPPNGPCMFHRTLYARHRVIDAIRARHRVGESAAFLARDFGKEVRAVRVLVRASTTQLDFLRRFRRPTCRKCWPSHDAAEACNA